MSATHLATVSDELFGQVSVHLAVCQRDDAGQSGCESVLFVCFACFLCACVCVCVCVLYVCALRVCFVCERECVYACVCVCVYACVCVRNV